MIQLREITGKENLLEAFVAHYAQAGGFPLDISYVRQCRTFAFMAGSQKMVGGFLINVTLPFRSLNDMPEEERNRVLRMLDLNETFEAMCFWFSHEIRGTFKMMRIWAELLVFLKRFPRRDLLGCTVWKSLFEQYSAVPISLLYQGQIHTPKRVLDKYVFLAQGKKGFGRGLVLEAWRRAKKLLSNALTPQSAKSARPAPMQRAA